MVNGERERERERRLHYALSKFEQTKKKMQFLGKNAESCYLLPGFITSAFRWLSPGLSDGRRRSLIRWKLIKMIMICFSLASHCVSFGRPNCFPPLYTSAGFGLVRLGSNGSQPGFSVKIRIQISLRSGHQTVRSASFARLGALRASLRLARLFTLKICRYISSVLLRWSLPVC